MPMLGERKRKDPRLFTMKKRKRKEEKRGGLLIKSRKNFKGSPLPVILLSNVQSLDNKRDEFFIRTKIENDFQNSAILIYTETWLTNEHQDSTFEPNGFKKFRKDRDPEETEKVKGGGVCIFINQRWCKDTKKIAESGSKDLEYLLIKCRPFYLPREFTSCTIMAVYIHPKANMERAKEELNEALYLYKKKNPLLYR